MERIKSVKSEQWTDGVEKVYRGERTQLCPSPSPVCQSRLHATVVDSFLRSGPSHPMLSPLKTRPTTPSPSQQTKPYAHIQTIAQCKRRPSLLDLHMPWSYRSHLEGTFHEASPPPGPAPHQLNLELCAPCPSTSPSYNSNTTHPSTRLCRCCGCCCCCCVASARL